MGESRSDTLGLDEQTYLRDAARHRLPDYDFHLRTNDDAMTWVVLEPAQASAETPRFTICRIDPCVMVMVEDRPSARRFCSTPSVEDAIAFALDTTARGARAVENVHDAPEMAQ